MTSPSASGYATGRILRPSAKSLPEHSRSHNRALVLQTLYRSGGIIKPLGLAPEGTLETYYERMHPDDREGFKQNRVEFHFLR